MADYKIDYDINYDKTYCDYTKRTHVWFAMPITFWIALIPQILVTSILWYFSVLSGSTIIFGLIFEIVTVRYCMKKGVTFLGLLPFMYRKRIQVYRPTPRRKRHTRKNLQNYFDHSM
ncbi:MULTISPECIES: hypothetical protein [Vibrio harveyi group]|uniref:hypothetical protein n=1 Tax=Vibrio harveyi group TaxID=717610 RepID=UPI0015F576DF|nr:hypothetical protein [Vibrio alginolyticus]EJE4208719.1 hypothetical protein [Vibrio parahaemolyticus]HDM8060830.1 hypothetical protein [Vibrio harveyi]